jgi:hypothetical protein
MHAQRLAQNFHQGGLAGDAGDAASLLSLKVSFAFVSG